MPAAMWARLHEQREAADGVGRQQPRRMQRGHQRGRRGRHDQRAHLPQRGRSQWDSRHRALHGAHADTLFTQIWQGCS